MTARGRGRVRGTGRFLSRPDKRRAGANLLRGVEHHLYEYTGACGSPEVDRARVTVREVTLSADGRAAHVAAYELVKGRVYMISANGVRSPSCEPLVHPSGAYSLNEIPSMP